MRNIELDLIKLHSEMTAQHGHLKEAEVVALFDKHRKNDVIQTLHELSAQLPHYSAFFDVILAKCEAYYQEQAAQPEFNKLAFTGREYHLNHAYNTIKNVFRQQEYSENAMSIVGAPGMGTTWFAKALAERCKDMEIGKGPVLPIYISLEDYTPGNEQSISQYVFAAYKDACAQIGVDLSKVTGKKDTISELHKALMKSNVRRVVIIDNVGELSSTDFKLLEKEILDPIVCFYNRDRDDGNEIIMNFLALVAKEQLYTWDGSETRRRLDHGKGKLVVPPFSHTETVELAHKYLNATSFETEVEVTSEELRRMSVDVGRYLQLLAGGHPEMTTYLLSMFKEYCKENKQVSLRESVVEFFVDQKNVWLPHLHAHLERQLHDHLSWSENEEVQRAIMLQSAPVRFMTVQVNDFDTRQWPTPSALPVPQGSLETINTMSPRQFSDLLTSAGKGYLYTWHDGYKRRFLNRAFNDQLNATIFLENKEEFIQRHSAAAEKYLSLATRYPTVTGRELGEVFYHMIMAHIYPLKFAVIEKQLNGEEASQEDWQQAEEQLLAEFFADESPFMQIYETLHYDFRLHADTSFTMMHEISVLLSAESQEKIAQILETKKQAILAKYST